MIANPDERKPAGALRQRLGVPAGRRLVGVAHAGVRGEIRELVPAATAADEVVTFDLFDRGALFPIAEWLGDCDALYCSAGYNAYWEARWLGYAERTRFLPFRRRNDDPAWRLRVGAGYAMRANGADTIAEWIVRG